MTRPLSIELLQAFDDLRRQVHYAIEDLGAKLHEIGKLEAEFDEWEAKQTFKEERSRGQESVQATEAPVQDEE